MLAYLDTLRTSVHDTIFRFEVSVAVPIVVHEDDSVDELLEVVCNHGLRQLLVRCHVQQIQQIWAVHQLPLQSSKP